MNFEIIFQKHKILDRLEKNDGYPILTFTTLLIPSVIQPIEIVIFPTITDGMLHLQSEISGNYTIIDLAGKVLNQNSFDGNTTMDVSTLQSGSYLIVINHNNQKITKRFIKK